MKKIVAFSIIILCLTANLPVFSQKTKSVSVNKVPAPKTLPQSNIKFISAEAFTDGNGVYLRWQTEYETKNLGFFVYRVGAKGAELVSPSIVASKNLNSSEAFVYGERYSFFDPDGSGSDSYYIESVGINGNRQKFDQIFTKSLTDLTAVAGLSSQELVRTKKSTSIFEKNLLVLPNEMRKEVEGNSLSPNIINQRFVASQPGVKIGVKQEGFYRVSRTELQNAGFNVGAAGNLWQLYVDGNEQSIVVGPDDSYIEFYGKGLDTPETATKVYFLIVGAQNGKRIDPVTIRPVGGNVAGRNYTQAFVSKYRQVYIGSEILNGEAENFFSNVPIIGSNSTPAVTTLNFNLTGVDFSVAKSSVELNVQGITSTPHQIVAKINGNALDPINGNGKNLMTGTFQIPTSILQEGANSLQLQTFGGSGDINLTESIKINYARKFEAVQNRLSFYTSNYRTSAVSGFTTQNIRAFDLTFPDNPTQLSNLTIDNNGGNYTINIPSQRGRPMFVVEDSSVLAVNSIVANNPSTLSTTAHDGSMIVVTYKDWATEANNWANYRRGQGMTVEVVDIEDIQDEFSYGSVSSTGMTQFFQYAKNNWQTPPNYILLLGDMSYDFRNYENRAFQNFMPTKLVDTVYEETGSDDALCDFNNDGLAEIAIGRIPARNAGDVTQALNKTMTFESTITTAFSRGATFVSDLPNGYDFEDLSLRLATQLPPSVPRTFINRGQTDAHNVLLANLNGGPYLVNYSGHGSAGGWDGGFISNADVLGLNNAPKYSLYYMLTCLNGYFLRTDFDSLSEAALKSTNGGAVAVWASTGKTTPDVQEVMATRFYSQHNSTSLFRLGDLIRDAKQNLNGGRDVRLSWALIGDPTLRVIPPVTP